MRSLLLFGTTFAALLWAAACETKVQGNHASGGSGGSSSRGGASTAGGSPTASGGASTASASPTASGGGGGGTGGQAAYCATVMVAPADCPPGSGKKECICIAGSMPCLGLDEAACKARDYCEVIRGDDPLHPEDPSAFLGCRSYVPGESSDDETTCTHPSSDADDCKEANDTLIPDGWETCGACDCTSNVTEADCPPGSDKRVCCCNFPDSMPCLGLDLGVCGESITCAAIMGRQWDPVAQQPTGPEIYLGCRSACTPEQPGGDRTCTHAPETSSCDLADDARIPDGWSTDCSVCTP